MERDTIMREIQKHCEKHTMRHTHTRFDQSKKYTTVDNIDEVCVQCQAGQHKKCLKKSKQQKDCECISFLVCVYCSLRRMCPFLDEGVCLSVCVPLYLGVSVCVSVCECVRLSRSQDFVSLPGGWCLSHCVCCSILHVSLCVSQCTFVSISQCVNVCLTLLV